MIESLKPDGLVAGASYSEEGTEMIQDAVKDTKKLVKFSSSEQKIPNNYTNQLFVYKIEK